MEAKALIGHIRESVGDAVAKGQEQISSANLLQFLNNLDAAVDAAEPLAQAQREFEKVQLEHSHQWDQEMFRSVIDSGQAALKAAFLVTGGGAAALLAFTGSAWKHLPAAGIQSLATALFLLGLGAFLIALASGFTYLAQSCFAQAEFTASKRWKMSGEVIRWIAVTFVLTNYGLFFWTVCLASDVLRMLTPS
uniref:Uncharacterized protein n=1 Tax=viral metagenome TaxID=1070528 RepID=A0A6H1ZEA4_9ZZZZ